MQKISLQEALPTAELLEELRAIEQEALPHERWDLELWQAFLLRRNCLLFTAVGGFALVALAPGEAELIKIAVRPEARRQGLGSALLNAAIEALQKRRIEQLFLEVRASNQAARNLYESLNFQRVGIRKDYYKTPREDALVYQIKL